MAFKILLATGLVAATGAVAHNGSAMCGTADATEAHIATSQANLNRAKYNLKSGSASFQAATMEVDVYFQVVAAGETEAQGYAPQSQIDEQMEILSAAYAPHGVTFNLVETIYTINSEWANGRNQAEMKAELRQGSYADLNIYTNLAIEQGAGVLGICPFPEEVSEGDATFLDDGCVIKTGTMPGGSETGYNGGGTLAHEVGHWMDLLHTFQGGCIIGDQVDDTPAMSSEPGTECRASVTYDTCPDQQGTDPIFNWMNYTGDDCWDEFTTGQEARMYSAWETYRQPLAAKKA